MSDDFTYAVMRRIVSGAASAKGISMISEEALSILTGVVIDHVSRVAEGTQNMTSCRGHNDASEFDVFGALRLSSEDAVTVADYLNTQACFFPS